MKKSINKINLLQRTLLTAILLVTSTAIHSQDVIYVNPKEVGRHMPPQPRWMAKRPLRQGAIRDDHPTAMIIMGKVTEITPALLFYRKHSDTTGALYSTPIAKIDSILFANGTLQKFTKEFRMPEHKRRDRASFANLGSNIISGYLGVFTHRVRFLGTSEENSDYTPFIKAGFSYEKVFLKDRLGIEVAPFVALNKKGYGTVLHAKFYPKNYGRFRLGVGPFYTLYVRDMANKYYNNTDWYNMTVERQVAMSVMGFGVQFQSHIDRNWLITFNTSFGGVIGYTDQYKTYPGYTKSSGSGMGQGELKLALGYRF